jgi:hypothetical protein
MGMKLHPFSQYPDKLGGEHPKPPLLMLDNSVADLHGEFHNVFHCMMLPTSAHSL